jgi:hypothetical protein
LATGNAGINRWQNISQRQNNEVVNSNGNFVYVDAIETRAQLFIGVRPSRAAKPTNSIFGTASPYHLREGRGRHQLKSSIPHRLDCPQIS